MKETTLLSKNPDYCNQHFNIIVGVTIALLILVALGLIGAIIYYLHKKPIGQMSH